MLWLDLYHSLMSPSSYLVLAFRYSSSVRESLFPPFPVKLSHENETVLMCPDTMLISAVLHYIWIYISGSGSIYLDPNINERSYSWATNYMLIDTNLFSDGFSVFFLDFLMAWFNKSERLKPAESRNMILWWTSIITLHCSMFKTSKVKNKYACFIVFDNKSHPATLSPISSSRVFFLERVGKNESICLKADLFEKICWWHQQWSTVTAAGTKI